MQIVIIQILNLTTIYLPYFIVNQIKKLSSSIIPAIEFENEKKKMNKNFNKKHKLIQIENLYMNYIY